MKIKWPTLFVILTFHILASLALLPRNFSWCNLNIFLGLYVITAMGITFGYHRMETHRAFQAHSLIRILALMAGSLALQGGPIDWMMDHKAHHKFSDSEMDRHDSNRGFWWSHMGWIFYQVRETEDDKYIRQKLNQDIILYVFNCAHIPLQLVIGTSLLSIGGWSMVVWGVFARTVFVYHVTWLINSATHKWGYRLFDTNDNSRNNWITAWLAFGEGWHNNHHAFPSSPRHGIQWFEIDLTWYLILILKKLGLVSKLKKIPKIP